MGENLRIRRLQVSFYIALDERVCYIHIYYCYLMNYSPSYVLRILRDRSFGRTSDLDWGMKDSSLSDLYL